MKKKVPLTLYSFKYSSLITAVSNIRIFTLDSKMYCTEGTGNLMGPYIWFFNPMKYKMYACKYQ